MMVRELQGGTAGQDGLVWGSRQWQPLPCPACSGSHQSAIPSEPRCSYRVISLAVPAVVLMLISGSMGLALTSTPCNREPKGQCGSREGEHSATHSFLPAWPEWRANRPAQLLSSCC